jgi:hypothetical protein
MDTTIIKTNSETTTKRITIQTQDRIEISVIEDVFYQKFTTKKDEIVRVLNEKSERILPSCFGDIISSFSNNQIELACNRFYSSLQNVSRIKTAIDVNLSQKCLDTDRILWALSHFSPNVHAGDIVHEIEIMSKQLFYDSTLLSMQLSERPIHQTQQHFIKSPEFDECIKLSATTIPDYVCKLLLDFKSLLAKIDKLKKRPKDFCEM